jgi:riboflavin synthase
MFTGIVEEVGRVRKALRRAAGLFLEVDASFGEELRAGDSIAVSGVCLTVVQCAPGFFGADVVRETLDHTYLASLCRGDPVNLERALRAGERMGGHFVQGHVDGVGTIVSLRKEGAGKRIAVRYPPELDRYFVQKGSVAVDGTSLTIAGVGDGLVEAALVPATLERTVLGRKRCGDVVHLEADLIGKYVEKAAGGRGRPADWYRENGYE